MRVRIVHPENAAGLIDPVTMRSPFINPETGAVIHEADVHETSFWVRRVLAGEIKRVDTTPTGQEPVAPLNTR